MTPSVIGSDLKLMGNAQSAGEVHVEGEIQGDIHCARLLVGENATITGGVVAEDVTVQGTVMGSIHGERVSLQSSSKVEGDVFHKSLAIEQGAYFEGKSRRSEDPIGSAPKLDQTAGTRPAGPASNGSNLPENQSGETTAATSPLAPLGISATSD